MTSGFKWSRFFFNPDPILMGTINLKVFLVAAKSDTDGDTFAIMTVLQCLVDSSSNESFSISVNLEFLYGIWGVFWGSTTAKALFLMQSFKAINDLLIIWV